jgi:tRNA A-37 threonylcarbamoyl transferase component Bud32
MTDPRSHLTTALSDRYRIERELGQGGMATVYLAEDLRHRRKVAVKVLRPELAATLGPDRFFREIEVAAQLQHPNILPLHDSGEAGGFLYYVMPFVQGESLRERLAKQGELPIHDAVKILSEVVDALAAAHALGVVHRDIKPDNVMLSGRHALVTDFGVAKAVSEATGKSNLTTAGVALGTPAYMAPEQAAADPHLDHRVDIYAVGCLGYELLTGRPPFVQKTPQEILAAHVTQAPEPVERHREAVPPALSAVIMKCLAKRPADRWQTAEQLLAQLEPLATPSGGMTPTQTRPVEAVPAGRSNKAVWVAGLAAVLAVSAGAVVVGTHRTRPTPVTLRDRTQLTTTGRIRYPAISPDGKQLAYAVTDCGSGGCRYGIELADVGGAATRRLLDGATAIYSIQWSPDRRNLLFAGSFGGHYGVYLVSVLGGAPRLVAAGGAAFWAGGDSLLLVRAPKPDSVFWIRISGLDGVPRDSIHVGGPAYQMLLVGVVPGSSWMIVALWHSPMIEWRSIDRQGREGGRIMWRATGGPVALSADAGWAQSLQAGANPRPPIIRVPFDPRTGRFSGTRDTVYTGQVTQFSVTADGGTLVLDEGTSDYSAWTLDLRDALHGAFADEHRLSRSTTPINIDLTPAGNRVLIRRIGGASAGGDQLAVVPFTGGTETPLPFSGSLLGWTIGQDSDLVALAEKTAAGVRFILTDLRNGARRTPFAIPDSMILDGAPLRDGGWVWIPAGGRTIRVQRRGDPAPKSLPVPDWYLGASGVAPAPEKEEAAITGFDAATYDSLGLSVMSLADGKVTPWVAIFGERSWFRWLPDGSILLSIWETQESVTLYRVRGPGRVERLGAIPRPVTSFSASSDLRRAVVVTKEYHGDAWMSRVVRP